MRKVKNYVFNPNVKIKTKLKKPLILRGTRPGLLHSFLIIGPLFLFWDVQNF